MTDFRSRADAIHQQLIGWRHHLHANPETGFEEVNTAAFIAERLREAGIAVHEGLAGTGVVGVLKGRRGQGPAIGLRADMDALNIPEANSFPHASRVQGKMHACGHDGHVTMLLGAARLLAEDPDFFGTINFIFQPAEESLGGARVMMEQGLFERFPCDRVFGLHNWPELPLGVIACRAGPVMAASDTLRITVEGKGTHAAMPHLGIDPVLVACHIVIAAQALVSRATDPTDSAVLSLPVIRAGLLDNVIPQTVELAGTIRTLLPGTRDRMERQLTQLVASVAAAFGASARLDYRRNYPAAINTPAEAEVAAVAAARVVGRDHVVTDAAASMGAEDFAFMLQSRPGCYAWLGQSGPEHRTGVHNPNYDFNDDLLPIGVTYWCELAGTALNMPA